MGSRERQKRLERFQLERFLEHRGIPSESLQQLEPPDPDALIDLEGRKVGIEVTSLFVRNRKSKAHPQPAGKPLPQELESVTDRIVSKAREIYFTTDSPPVLATLCFSDRTTLDKKRGDQIAKLLADKIQRMNRQSSQAADWRPAEDEEVDILSESVTFIHVLPVPERHFARWTVARAGFVASLTPERLQERIDEKAEKIEGYKRNVGEVWLLIVVDRRLPSQKFDGPDNFPPGSLSSHFARTFYFDFVDDRLIELCRNGRSYSA
jgi:hypothetical protein